MIKILISEDDENLLKILDLLKNSDTSVSGESKKNTLTNLYSEFEQCRESYIKNSEALKSEYSNKLKYLRSEYELKFSKLLKRMNEVKQI